MPTIEDDGYMNCLAVVRDNGLFDSTDVPYRGKVYKGLVEKVRTVLEQFADGTERNGKVQSLSELTKTNKVPISIWSLSMLYPELHQALQAAERARADRLNEKSLDQLFEDEIIDEYARDDLGNIQSAGVALLKARSDALQKQASIANKGKFGKDTGVTFNVRLDALEDVKSLEDLDDIDMIELQPAGRRERNR